MTKLAAWPAAGDVIGGFCRACRSHFCPHAAPDLYPGPERVGKVPPRGPLEFRAVPASKAALIRRKCEALDDASRGRSSHRQMKPGSTYYPGKLAEYTYAAMVGLEELFWQSMEVLDGGDDGCDFPGVDVKCVSADYFPRTHLMVMPANLATKARKGVRAFASFAYNAELEIAYLGWATLDEIAAAPITSFGHRGYEAHAIVYNELRSGPPNPLL